MTLLSVGDNVRVLEQHRVIGTFPGLLPQDKWGDAYEVLMYKPRVGIQKAPSVLLRMPDHVGGEYTVGCCTKVWGWWVYVAEVEKV